MTIRKFNLVLATLLVASTQTYAASNIETKRKPKLPVQTEPTNGGGTDTTSGAGISPVDAFANPDPNGHAKIIDALEDPNTKTVQMWMFSMSNPAVIKALEDAGNRDAKVTIIFNAAMFEGTEDKIPTELATAKNVTVLRATPKFSITHAKTFIVNGDDPKNAYAWIMSLNTTQNFPNQADFAVKTVDPDVISDLKNLFAADVANSTNKTGTTPDIKSENLVVSPVNSLDRILALINSASSTIDMTVENLAYSMPTPNDPASFTQVVDALTAKIKSGVKVRVITPSCDMNPSNPGFNLTALAALNKVANNVGRVMPYPGTPQTPYMHQKLIIVDGKRFYVGSENFSSNSLTKAREIGVIAKVGGPDDIVIGDFNTEWSNTEVPPDSIPKGCDAFGGSGNSTKSELTSKEPEEDAKQAEVAAKVEAAAKSVSPSQDSSKNEIKPRKKSAPPEQN